MEVLIPVLAVLLIFGGPATVLMYWLKLRHERRMKELEVQQGGAELPLLQAAKQDMEARVQNLESIVCGVDYELSAKLNQLASRQLLLEAAHPTAGKDAAFAPAETIATASLSPGARLADRFVVQERLGRGGMGTVYLATDEQLSEPVALKVIGSLGLLDSSSTERFRREASAARRVSHPNVVRLHDIGESEGILFLSMEYVAGTTLARLLEQHGALPLDRLRAMVVDVCLGLQAAHEAGVVHRDLKPGNIIIDEQQRAKIIDFGLAWVARRQGMTVTGTILGTPEYMSPEQVRGQPVDARSDIYSLGAVLYHALSGSLPFTGDTPIAIGFAHCAQPLPPLQQRRPELPMGWVQLVDQAMAKDPAHRFASAQALAAALPPA